MVRIDWSSGCYLFGEGENLFARVVYGGIELDFSRAGGELRLRSRSLSDEVVLTGAGWAIGSVLLFALFTTADHLNLSSLWTVVVGAPAIGALTIGAPMYAAARRTGSAAPRLEAMVWLVLAAVVTGLFVLATTPDFEAVNVVTTEDLRNRAQHGSGRFPGEVVWFARCVVAYAVLGAIGSVLVNSGRFSIAGALWRVGVLSAGAAASLVGSALLFAIGGPILWGLVPGDSLGVVAAAFLVGCFAGFVLLGSRSVVLRQ